MSLSENERAMLRPGIDVTSLERLLDHLTGAERQYILQFFTKSSAQEIEGVGGRGGSESIPEPVLRDPELRALFVRVTEPQRRQQAETRRRLFPPHWRHLERPFALIAIDEAGDDVESRPRIIYRSTAEGGDAILLPADLVRLDVVLRMLETLMTAPARGVETGSRTEPVDLEAAAIPALGHEARREVDSLLRFLASVPGEPIPSIGRGRSIDVWLLGSP